MSNVKNLYEVVYSIPTIARNIHQMLCLKLMKFDILFEKNGKNVVSLKFVQVENLEWIIKIIGKEQDDFVKFLIRIKNSLNE